MKEGGHIFEDRPIAEALSSRRAHSGGDTRVPLWPRRRYPKLPQERGASSRQMPVISSPRQAPTTRSPPSRNSALRGHDRRSGVAAEVCATSRMHLNAENAAGKPKQTERRLRLFQALDRHCPKADASIDPRSPRPTRTSSQGRNRGLETVKHEGRICAGSAFHLLNHEPGADRISAGTRPRRRLFGRSARYRLASSGDQCVGLGVCQ